MRRFIGKLLARLLGYREFPSYLNVAQLVWAYNEEQAKLLSGGGLTYALLPRWLHYWVKY